MDLSQELRGYLLLGQPGLAQGIKEVLIVFRVLERGDPPPCTDCGTGLQSQDLGHGCTSFIELTQLCVGGSQPSVAERRQRNPKHEVLQHPQRLRIVSQHEIGISHIA